MKIHPLLKPNMPTRAWKAAELKALWLAYETHIDRDESPLTKQRLVREYSIGDCTISTLYLAGAIADAGRLIILTDEGLALARLIFSRDTQGWVQSLCNHMPLSFLGVLGFGRWFSYRQAARDCGVAPSTLYGWCEAMVAKKWLEKSQSSKFRLAPRGHGLVEPHPNYLPPRALEHLDQAAEIQLELFHEDNRAVA
ncbi:MAG: hypothetical protein AAF236_09885 [Verrucomicrobiota bacterium]